MELPSDKRLERNFNSSSNSKFWLRNKMEYPKPREIAMRFLLCFPTTYLCEAAFPGMTVLKTKQRNRLQLSDCPCLAITAVRFRINKLTDRKTYGGRQRFWWGNLIERYHWGDPDVNGKIILRWVFSKCEGVVVTGWSSSMTGTGGGHL
jgi:hypothetical protein